MTLRTTAQRRLLFGFIYSIVACALVGIYCLIGGSMGMREERILVTTATVGACSILALASAIPWERRRWHPIGPLGVLAATIALLMTLVEIWDSGPPAETWFKALGTTWVFAITLPHLGALSLSRLKRQWQFVLIFTVISTIVLASQIIATILFEIYLDDWNRVTGILAIMTAAGTISVPILHSASKLKTQTQVTTSALTLSMTCPRCSTPITLQTGRSTCSACNLRFRIEIEEDNCEKCGYPLYQLTSAQCPECGTPISRPPTAQPVA